MAQTLNATLAAAQSLTERKPLVEVLSDKFVPTIPFVGQRIAEDFPSGGPDGDTSNETGVSAITLSDGRLAILSIMSDTTWGYLNPSCRLILTDANRTVLTSYTLPFSAGYDTAIVEMADGNLGLMKSDGYYRILNITDSPGTVIYSGHYGTAGWPDPLLVPISTSKALNAMHTTVVRLTDGSYMAAYVATSVPGGYGDIAIKISTSPDFRTWSAPVAVPLVSSEIANLKYNPFLFVTEDGKVNLLFEYVEAYSGPIGVIEKVNIYHYVSADNGATWDPAPGSNTTTVGPLGWTIGAITHYPDYTVTPRHPYAIALGGGSWRISYHESQSALHMDTNTYGWEGTDEVVGVHFDEVSRLAYVVSKDYHDFGGIVVVNPDTWEPVKSIWSGSTPTFSSMWWGGTNFSSDTVGERELTVVRKNNHIGIYDSVTDQITEFHFDAWPEFGVVPNVTPKARGITGGIGGGENDMSIAAMFLDYDNRILYLYWQIAYLWGGCYAVGKIDLTQSGPDYTHDVIFTKNSPGLLLSQAQMTAPLDFKVYPNDDLIVISGGWTNMEGLGGPWIGFTLLYTLAGMLVKNFDVNNSDTYPYRGLKKVAKVGMYIYGTFQYEPLYDQAGRYGIARINLADFSVDYYRPTFSTVDEYGFTNLIPIKDGDELLLSSSIFGASRFIIADASWVLYTNDELPGLFPGTDQSCESLAYDTVNSNIFLGSVNNQMLIYFNEDGYFNQPQYLDAAWNGTDWVYGTNSPLVVSMTDRDVVMAPDPSSSGSMYAFWIHIDPTTDEWRVRWEKDVAEFNLTDYLASGSSVQIKRSIDGTPNKLSFTVTHGHLFDPHNVDSLWSIVLKKYRRIRVRFGEEVSGVEYWHDAGTFVVLRSKMAHERGTYPQMQVEAEDIRTWWEDAEIVATEHYEATPETILTDIIHTFAGMDPSDIVLPSMEGSYEIWFQWLDSSTKKIVDALCNRFGYFPTITVGNKFTCRKISNANAVDHTYADGTMIKSFSPNDEFSDFTNRVTVIGETRDFNDVLYEEEAVGHLYGTSGWWGNKQTYTVYYSEDHRRKAKNPRLVVIESCVPNGFIQKLGGGSERITYVDVDELYCIVTVETPDMSVTAWTTGASVLALGIAMAVVGMKSPWTGWGMFIGWVILLSILLYILSGIVNWQYEIWARPYGQQRLGCSGQANDVELQAQLGNVIEKKIDEPLAIDPSQCQWIAEHELMIVMAQRNRVQFEKIAHLQDEEGDTIVIPHPYTGKNMTVFVTDLTRTYEIPGLAGGKSGFTDSIEGWKVAPV